jgi:outer membrane protein assembly factor BamB
MQRRKSLFLFSWMSILWAVVSAEDWPQFRGPGAQGHSSEKNLPTVWGPDKNIAWKREIPGEGWSSPIVQGGKVYLTTALTPEEGGKKSKALHALALEAESGKILWNVEVFAPDSGRAWRKHTKNSHASPTPVTDGKRLWVHFGTTGTACLDLDGKVIWRNRELEYSPVHGGGGSPALVDDVLVMSCDGAKDPFVVALDRGTGKIRWKTPRSESDGKLFSFSTPLVFAIKGQKQVFVPGSNWASSYDPKTGKELWRVWHGGYSVVPRPVMGHGNIYFSSSFDSASMMAVRPNGKGDVSKTHVTWKVKRGAPHSPSPLLVGGELYFVSDRGIASCVDAKTGDQHWQKRIGGGQSASPFYADGKIYFQSEGGQGVVIRASKEFEIISRNDLQERSLASCTPSGGAIYIRTEKRLWCVREGK